MVSGSISLPSPGFFSPFPHGTSALSVATEYLALDRGRPRFRPGFSCPAVLRYRIMETNACRVRGFHPLRPAFPEPFRYTLILSQLHGLSPCGPTTPVKRVWALPISLAATFGISGGSLLFLISVPGLLRWFSSPSVASITYFIQLLDAGITPSGLPHSAICGSQDMCSSPQLFAAYHGLLRLVAPRHPPYTYCSLDHIIVSSSIALLLFAVWFKHAEQACALLRRALSPFKAGYPPRVFQPGFLPDNQRYFYTFQRFRRFVPFPVICQISRVRIAPFGSSAGLLPNVLVLLVKARQVMGLIRVELMTPSLSEKCSNQLSYRPV